jgi:hypothetical protein
MVPICWFEIIQTIQKAMMREVYNPRLEGSQDARSLQPETRKKPARMREVYNPRLGRSRIREVYNLRPGRSQDVRSP